MRNKERKMLYIVEIFMGKMWKRHEQLVETGKYL